MNLAGQRVLVVGGARSGIAAARFLLSRGSVVTLSDRRPLEELGEARSLGVLLETGGHNQETFLDQDMIVLSPGVSASLPELAAARGKGIPVIAEAELGARFLRGRLVGITGSNGKTTTTALTGKLFEAAGFHTQVGGNIGTPLVSLVDTSRADTVNVVELSSFQLETIQQLRPTVAVVLNVTPDHLDRHGSMEAYAAAKARIFENQTPQDFAVLNSDDEICKRLADKTSAQVLMFSRLHEVAAGAFVDEGDLVYSAGAFSFTVMPSDEIPLKGGHNVENVLAALSAALALESNPQALRKAVREFKAVENRLEFVARFQDVDYYNDSKATNVDATVKSLEAFDIGKVVIIMGGLDKGAPYAPLIPLLKKKARAAVLIGAATEKIAAELGDTVPLVRAGTLDVAVKIASTHARPGDTVLLAPACASFDQFRNYEHRGEAFKELVRKLV